MRKESLISITDKIFVISLFSVSLLSRHNLTVILSSSVGLCCGRNGTSLTTGRPARAGQFGRIQPSPEHKTIYIKSSYFTGIAIFEIIVLKWDLGGMSFDKGAKGRRILKHAIFYGEMGKTVSNCSSSQLLFIHQLFNKY